MKKYTHSLCVWCFWHVCTSSDCEWIFGLFAKETRNAVMPTVALAEQLQKLTWKWLCVICCFCFFFFPPFWCCPWQWSVRKRRWLTASMCARGTTRSTESWLCPRCWLDSLCSSSRAAGTPRRSSEQIIRAWFQSGLKSLPRRRRLFVFFPPSSSCLVEDNDLTSGVTMSWFHG